MWQWTSSVQGKTGCPSEATCSEHMQRHVWRAGGSNTGAKAKGVIYASAGTTGGCCAGAGSSYAGTTGSYCQCHHQQGQTIDHAHSADCATYLDRADSLWVWGFHQLQRVYAWSLLQRTAWQLKILQELVATCFADRISRHQPQQYTEQQQDTGALYSIEVPQH